MNNTLADEIMYLMQTGRAHEARWKLARAPAVQMLRSHKKASVFHLADDDLWERMQQPQARQFRAAALRRMLDLDVTRIELERRILAGNLDQPLLEGFLNVVREYADIMGRHAVNWNEQNARLTEFIQEANRVADVEEAVVEGEINQTQD